MKKDYKIKSLNLKKQRIKYQDKKLICPICGNEMNRKASVCLDCFNKQKAQNIPPKETLKQEIRTTPFTTLSKKYNVSDNAIRKWCKKYNLPYKSTEIKKYSDEEWKLL